jgi:hypothetical protein
MREKLERHPVDLGATSGKDAKYNDVANWRYSELPNVFSRDKKPETHVIQTGNELDKVQDSPQSGMVFVELIMDKYDEPIDLIVGGHALADSDYGVPGLQSTANAQIPLPAGRAALRRRNDIHSDLSAASAATGESEKPLVGNL